MGWHARLSLDYASEAGRSVARYQHDGPLRILQSLYPEGDTVCHNVLVHPPGGLVGGDTLDMQVTVGANSHALVTTPGATRFYRSEAGLATQQVRAVLEDGARLEWLPLETIAFPACDALNRARFALAPSAEMMAWDLCALGLPHAQQPFEQGVFRQHLEIEGVWLERGRIDAADRRWLDSPLAMAGQRALATLVFASGRPIARERAEEALRLARARMDAVDPALGLQAGATQPHPQLLVLRTLSPVIEPALDLLRPVWAAWREHLWQRPGTWPRLWRM